MTDHDIPPAELAAATAVIRKMNELGVGPSIMARAALHAAYEARGVRYVTLRIDPPHKLGGLFRAWLRAARRTRGQEPEA